MSMLLATFTWLLLDRSHWAYILDRLADNNESKLLWEVNQGLEEERQALQERVLMLERTTSVDRQTAAALQEEIRDLQEQVYVLKRELEFYQGVMDATRDARGLSVHGIHVDRLNMPRTYRFKLVLTHVASGGAVAEGKLDIDIAGTMDGTGKILDIQDLAAGDTINLAYKLRSFQRFETRILLPEGFSAERVIIQLQPKNKNQAIIREVFEWSAPVN